MRSVVALLLSSLLLSSVVLAAPSGITHQNEPSNPNSQRSRDLNEKGAVFAQSAKFNKAEEAFREAVTLDPKNSSAIFNLASVLIQQGELEEATFLLEKHAHAAKTDAGLFARLGDVYFSSQKIAKARTAYEKALELSPELPKIPGRLGTVYSLSSGLNNHLDLAIKQYLHAVEQEPNNTEYLSNLVNLYLVTNEAQKAVSTAKRALQVDPSPQLYASLGAAYELQQEWSNSLIAYKRAKDLGDSSDETKDKIKALQTQTRND